MTKFTYHNRAVDFVMQGVEEDVRAAFVDFAEAELEDAIRESDPDGYDQYVDRVKGAPIESVKKGGGVLFEFHYLRTVAEAGLRILEDTSPVDTSEYIEAHTVFVDGMPVDNMDALNTARRAIIANTVKYSRIIERGMGKHVPWSTQPQVPAEGVYTAAAKALRRQYGQIADITLTWVDVPGVKGRSPAIAIERR